MVDWSTIKSLTFTFGPIVVPYLIGQYRKIRVQLASSGPAHPPPKEVYRALTVLFIAIAIFVVLSFPYFQPENLFTLTQSRMQTPNNVLFERIKQLRPYGQLNYADETFEIRLQLLEARCLYMKFGPDAILDCLWCSPMDPRSYIYYSLPEVLGVHAWNFLAIGLATSVVFAGTEGSKWRFHAAFGGIALAALDVYYCNTWDWKYNARTKAANELVFFYWRMRTLRPLAVAALDACIAGALWLSSTGRFFAQPMSSAEKVDSLTRKLANVQAKASGAGILQNAISRNAGLRQHANQYWEREGQIMQDAMAEPQVVQSVNRALSRKLNMKKVERDAKDFSENLVQTQIEESNSSP